MRTHKNPRCNTRKTRKSSTWVNMLSLLNMQDASCVLHQSNASNRSMYTQHWASCQKSERPLCIRNSHQLVRKNYTEPLHSEITGTSCLTMSAHASVWLQWVLLIPAPHLINWGGWGGGGGKIWLLLAFIMSCVS